MSTKSSQTLRGGVIVIVLLALGSCAADSTPPQSSQTSATPSSPTSATSTASPLPEPGDDLPADERAAFDQAQQRWTDYEAATAPLWEAGRVTEEARTIFQSFFMSPVWQQYVERLRTYQDAQVTISGLPTILWSEPRQVSLSDSGGSVVIRQCVDYSSQTFRQAGQEVERYQFPVQRTATLDRADGSSEWMLLRISEPAGDTYNRCEARS